MEVPGVEDLEEIGRGGMAVVFMGRQPEFSRQVAVKVVTVAGVDESHRRRFEQELQAVGALSEHPNIITVHGAGETAEGLPYLVMGYQPSGSLADRLEARGPLPAPEVLEIGVKMAGALESAHRAGVLHRDLKPENILVSSFGEPVLADFGIARLEGGAHLTASGMVTGTPAHSAPEVLSGRPPTPASDVYGLASTLHQLLAGAPAFVRPTDENTLVVMNRALTEPPPDLRVLGVPAALADVLDGAMAKDPAGRPATAAAFGQALQGVQQGLGLAVTPLPVALEAGAEADTNETVVVGAPVVPLAATDEDPVAPTPSPVPVAPVSATGDGATGGGGRRGLIAVVVALVLVIGVLAVLLLTGGEDGGDDEAATTTEPTTTTESTTTTTTTTTVPPTTVFVPDPATAVPVALVSPVASATAADGVDLSGNPVSYSAANLADGVNSTAWRVDGDGVGQTITLQLAQPVYVTEVGLIPGYDKVDPVDGTDRFYENRRVRAVRWTFDGGVSVDQAFADTRDLQVTQVSPTLTRTVRVTILETTSPGGRDFTPISELAVRGVPAP